MRVLILGTINSKIINTKIAELEEQGYKVIDVVFITYENVAKSCIKYTVGA